MDCPLLHTGIGCPTIIFGVVAEIMLQRRPYVHLIGTSHISFDHACSKIGILTQVFEISAIERTAVDVHSGPQNEVPSGHSELLGHCFPILPGNGWFPSGGQKEGTWKSRGFHRVIEVHAQSATCITEFQLGNTQAWHPCRAKTFTTH